MKIVPEIFEARDDDCLYLLDASPPKLYGAKVAECANRCPKLAKSVRD